MRLFIIRHGETVFNRKSIIQGNIDSELTSLGESQASLTSSELKNVPIDNIFSSPTSRTYITALSIAKPHRLPVVKVPALVERNYGIYEGKLMRETKMAHPEYFSDYSKLDFDVKPKQGESINDVSKRVSRFMERLQKNFPKKVIVLVAHGIVNKVIITNLLNNSLSKIGTYRQGNTCINELLIENGKAEAVRLNYREHLKNTPE
ncbi:MAG: histidine phosphatase family protein [Candidatus Micrarchaeota archaeon]